MDQFTLSQAATAGSVATHGRTGSSGLASGPIAQTDHLIELTAQFCDLLADFLAIVDAEGDSEPPVGTLSKPLA